MIDGPDVSPGSQSQHFFVDTLKFFWGEQGRFRGAGRYGIDANACAIILNGQIFGQTQDPRFGSGISGASTTINAAD